MRRTLLLVTFLAVFAGSFAQTKPAASAAKPKPAANSISALEDTISYSLGVYMMQQLLAKTGFFPSNQALFKKAVDDMMQNKATMINPATAEQRLLAYQKLFQLEKGKKLEELLFAKAKASPGFQSLPNGVYFQVSNMGTGVQPTVKDTVVMNVIITLPDGTEVENTNKSKQSYMAVTGSTIPGLRDLLILMKQGTICRAIIPSRLAYGEIGTATIPPNSAVILDVALVSVKPAK